MHGLMVGDLKAVGLLTGLKIVEIPEEALSELSLSLAAGIRNQRQSRISHLIPPIMVIPMKRKR
jgi:hypothetical protein